MSKSYSRSIDFLRTGWQGTPWVRWYVHYCSALAEYKLGSDRVCLEKDKIYDFAQGSNVLPVLWHSFEDKSGACTHISESSKRDHDNLVVFMRPNVNGKVQSLPSKTCIECDIPILMAPHTFCVALRYRVAFLCSLAHLRQCSNVPRHSQIQHTTSHAHR